MHEEPGEVERGRHVVAHTEQWPVLRDALVVDELGVEQVEQPMTGKRDHDQPKVPAKPDDGYGSQHGIGSNLRNESLGGPSEHGKEEVIGADCERDGGIECAIPVHSHSRSDQGHAEGERQSDKKFHHRRSFKRE